MPALITPFDRAVRNSNRLRIVMRIPNPQAGGTESRDIYFQLPPKISNDSRDGEWEEKSGGPNSGDKIAVYKSANPRRITVEWQYIVGFDGWTIAHIKKEIRTLRGYFRNPFIEGDGEKALSPLVIELLLWSIGGDERMSFRLVSSNIKHGKTLVGTNGDDTFPLVTDISIELKSWPKILGTTNEEDGPPVQTVPGQRTFTPDWF